MEPEARRADLDLGKVGVAGVRQSFDETFRQPEVNPTVEDRITIRERQRSYRTPTALGVRAIVSRMRSSAATRISSLIMEAFPFGAEVAERAI